MYLPQIAEMVVSCQQMTQEDYEQWKQETLQLVPNEANDFMQKVFAVVDMYSGHRKASNDLHMETYVCAATE